MDEAHDILSGPHQPWRHGTEAPAPRVRAAFPPSGIRTTGQYFATFVPLALRQETVARLLPRGLELITQAIAPPGKHVLLFVFGRQRHVRPIFRNIKGLDYHEFLLAVPHVRLTQKALGYGGPFVFLPRLFLDHWLPVLLGWMCGFEKKRADVEDAEYDYAIRSLIGHSPVIRGSFPPPGPAGSPSDFPNFNPMRDIFEMPLVTRVPFGFLSLDFAWELEHAKMAAIHADMSIERSFLAGLPVESFRVEGIDQAALGGFRLEVPWTLSRPFWPSSLRPQAAEAVPEESVLPPPHFRMQKSSPVHEPWDDRAPRG